MSLLFLQVRIHPQNCILVEPQQMAGKFCRQVLTTFHGLKDLCCSSSSYDFCGFGIWHRWGSCYRSDRICWNICARSVRHWRNGIYGTLYVYSSFYTAAISLSVDFYCLYWVKIWSILLLCLRDVSCHEKHFFQKKQDYLYSLGFAWNYFISVYI